MGIHGPAILRSDGENALGDLLRGVAETRRPQTLVERGPRVDAQANGRAERAVRSVEEQVRFVKSDLESRIGVGIDPSTGLFE